MESYSELSVDSYQITLRHIQKDGSLHTYVGFTQAGRMKPRYDGANYYRQIPSQYKLAF
jgi:hypothetical protein